MNVIIEKSVFTDPSKNESDLITLFRFGFEGRHRILTEPAWSPEHSFKEIEQWLGRQDGKLREECELALELGALERGDDETPFFTLRISIDKQDDPKNHQELILPLGEAVRFLEQPFKILVEDNINDKNFLLAVAKIDSKKRKTIDELIENKWIDFEHGGGSGIEKRIETKKNKRDRIRLWVLFDSDALRPEKPSTISMKLKETCEKLQLSHHQLKRRAIENYLPIYTLDRWEREKRKDQKKKRRGQKNKEDSIRKYLLSAFKRLAPEQRYHFNMKEGFDGDEKRADKDRVGDLYQNLDEQDRSTLSKGFGKKIAELFGREDMISDVELQNDAQALEITTMLENLLRLI